MASSLTINALNAALVPLPSSPVPDTEVAHAAAMPITKAAKEMVLTADMCVKAGQRALAVALASFKQAQALTAQASKVLEPIAQNRVADASDDAAILPYYLHCSLQEDIQAWLTDTIAKVAQAVPEAQGAADQMKEHVQKAEELVFVAEGGWDYTDPHA